MNRPFFQSGRRQRGFYIIGIIIVLVIIMVLVFTGPLSRDPVTQVNTATTQIDRSQDVACSVNRNAIKTNLVHFQINNPGEPVTLEVIQNTNPTPCPDGGVYLMGQDGTIYCTKHMPPPAEQMQQMLPITKPQPVGTPVPTPDPYAQTAPQMTPFATPDPYAAR